MIKVQAWTLDECRKQMLKKLDACMKHRSKFEGQWEQNYLTINTTVRRPGEMFNFAFDEVVNMESGAPDMGDSVIGMNYTFKYLRFFHAQLSANPPSVVARPTSFDPSDRRKADAADRLVRFGRKDQLLDEIQDQTNLNMLWSGNGWLKLVWDPNRGDVYDFNEETQELTMKGDTYSYAPSVYDVWVDPDARRWAEVRYIIERVYMPYDEACQQFGAHKEELKKALISKNSGDTFDQDPTVHTDRVAVFEYYEKAAPLNGMAGRRIWFLEDGTIIATPSKNPHPKGQLPYHLLTYIDVPDQVYGKSIIEYVSRLQDMLNRLDSAMLDSVQAHGVVRMLVPEGTELEDLAISNSNWDYIRYSGTTAPHLMAPTAMPGDMWKFREQLLVAIQELYGINDSMLGIQRREQSAVSQQTSIEAGTMIHRRLFKKYAMQVESVYKSYLELIRENWDEPRTVLVLGKEKAFEAADFKGADIAGGFDLSVEYGTSLPLDPNMRREAIMLLMEPLKEAGMSMKQILTLMKLNDLEGMYDRMEMAAERQREVFEEMIALFYSGSPEYIPPKKKQEHAGMLEYAYDYIMSSEFNNQLDEALQELIYRHIEEREQLEAQTQAAATPAPTQVPGLPGVSGAQTPAVGAPQPTLTALLGGG